MQHNYKRKIMDLDLKPFFEKYEAIANQVDAAFQRVRDRYPAEVQCKPGCADCCHAMFDLTLVEAMYLNHHFNNTYSGADLERLLENAGKLDRQAYKIKKSAYQMSREGVEDEVVLKDVAHKRLRCPLLNADDTCDLYAHRPIACRCYGIPQAIGGKGHTCGLSGFHPGQPYPSINRDIIHDQLAAISAALAQAIGSKYTGLADILVPVSMALITVYDDEYLGVKTDDGTDNNKQEREDT
jgi:Fe-S-cluster containining protein